MMFQGKDILFIAPVFYGYEKHITDALTSLGAKVTFLPEMDNSFLSRVAKKVSSNYWSRLQRKNLKKISTAANNDDFDYVFIIRGAGLTTDFMKYLKLSQANAKFFLYQWDSYRQNDYRDIIPYFDFVSSFDVADSKELNIPYQPLFYLPIYEGVGLSKGDEKKYDLSFVGAYHSDRLNIIKFFDKEMEKDGLKFHYHLYLKKIPLLVRLISGEISLRDVKYIKTYSLTMKDVVDNYSFSKAVLDVELNIQTGLSMRTFEVLGSGLKLITTNHNILEHDFYDMKNMAVIDRNKLHYDSDLFSDRGSIMETDISNYSIFGWIDRVFDVNESKGDRI
ncbi:hypothetical protein [Vibrio tapetis]|uniref:Polysaccharide biosynthesis protein n=1 Tax=Vibrio tapetis subsp. tapetis TaxID=1671868 RepID=A0A2N8ZGB7_9VIBR|nr:hypothetical protein [Vibrio tapetis]SON50962.1 Polysaccharide biosynthesis protein [Vibrio tapetis subsp. tapetis]